MEGLLGNPVIQGLLGGAGPMGVRAQSQQQMAAMTPRSAGGMLGAPSAPAQGPSGMDQVAAGIGDAISGYTAKQEKEEQFAAETKMYQDWAATLSPEMQAKVKPLIGSVAGHGVLGPIVGKGFSPDSNEFVNVTNPKTGDTQTIAKGTQPPPGFVLAGAASLETPKAEKIKLWFGDKSVDVTPGTETEKYYRQAGYKSTPALGGSDDGEPDFTKGWASVPDGEGGSFAALTPKGISDRIEKPVEAASALRGYMNKVREGVRLFIENGNSQALLSSMITFQKALDDGAVVREGDIVLQRSAAGVSSRISQFLEQAATGAPISSDLAGQMVETMESFAEQGLNSYRSVIDPLVAEGNGIWGPRSMASVMPGSTYENIFGTQKPKADAPPRATVAAPPLIGEPNPSNTSDASLPPGETPRFESTDDPKWQRFSKMSPQGRANFLKTLKGNEPLLYLFTLEEVEGRAAVDELDRILREGRAK